MTQPPANPKLYHITHVDNLQSIVRDGGLLSDKEMSSRGGPKSAVGINNIKAKRLSRPVRCWPGDHVGEYVPFYFCPRSVMLYIIAKGNHPDLTYHGGQGPIVHLEADLHEVVKWADGDGQRWAFSLSNAGAGYSEFRNSVDRLGEIDWAAVASTDFTNAHIKEAKQSEFLVREFFPWSLVRRIGVQSVAVQKKVLSSLWNQQKRPVVQLLPDWYF